jgi:DNA-binding NarL/FixJ family response regulator
MHFLKTTLYFLYEFIKFDKLLKFMAKLIICDDQQLFRMGLKSALSERGFEIIAEANDGEEAFKILSTLCPDILICDINMPKMNGIELLTKINQQNLSIKVLMLSGYDDDSYLLQSYKEGASGYLLKETDTNELVMAINKIFLGGIYFGQHATATLFKQVTALKEYESSKIFDKLRQKLSLREIEILEFIAKGYINKEIAEKLHLSVRTIDSHRANIQEKINAKNTADLVRIYYKGA